MKINKIRDIGSIGIIIVIMGLASLYVGITNNLKDNSGTSYIVWGCLTVVIATIMIIYALFHYNKQYPKDCQKIKKYIFGICGFIIGLTGGTLCFIGNQINNDIKRQLSSYITNGNADSTGDILFYIGIALAIIGVLMIIINIFQYFFNKKEA